jgi:hypothetical protein
VICASTVLALPRAGGPGTLLVLKCGQWKWGGLTQSSTRPLTLSHTDTHTLYTPQLYTPRLVAGSLRPGGLAPHRRDQGVRQDGHGDARRAGETGRARHAQPPGPALVGRCARRVQSTHSLGRVRSSQSADAILDTSLTSQACIPTLEPIKRETRFQAFAFKCGLRRYALGGSELQFL